MKRWTGLILVVFFFFSLLSGCAFNQEQRRKEGLANRNLGEAYMIEGKYPLALKTLLKAEQLTPKDVIIQNDLGLTLMRMGKLALAKGHFKQALELKPDYADAQNNLAAIYLEMKQWDEAINLLKGVEENLIYGSPQNAYVNLGWAYFNKKEYDKAEAQYKKAVKHYRDGFPKDDTYIRALGGLARLYIATNRPADALPLLKEALKSVPTLPEAHFDMGQAYEDLNQRGKARAAYKKTIALAPDTELADKAAEALQRLAE